MVKGRGIGMLGGASESFFPRLWGPGGSSSGLGPRGSFTVRKREGASSYRWPALCRRQRGAFGCAEGLKEQRLHASHLRRTHGTNGHRVRQEAPWDWRQRRPRAAVLGRAHRACKRGGQRSGGVGQVEGGVSSVQRVEQVEREAARCGLHHARESNASRLVGE